MKCMLKFGSERRENSNNGEIRQEYHRACVTAKKLRNDKQLYAAIFQCNQKFQKICL